MITLDRAHLGTTHQAAAALDVNLRASIEKNAGKPAPGSIADLVQMLREHGDYWQRAQNGRLRTVRRVLARLTQPFFSPQIRYNLLLAEALGRIEESLAELRQEMATTQGPGESGPATTP
jgi:hypothetical protein